MPEKYPWDKQCGLGLCRARACPILILTLVSDLNWNSCFIFSLLFISCEAILHTLPHLMIKMKLYNKEPAILLMRWFRLREKKSESCSDLINNQSGTQPQIL
jgi:hypothetical protein